MDDSKGKRHEDLVVMIQGAGEIVSQLQSLSQQIDEKLTEGSSIDELIETLNDQKNKVDALRQITFAITSNLAIDEGGRSRDPIPELAKIAFEDLIRGLTRLVDTQSRIETLLAAKGIPISNFIRRSGR